VGDALHLPPYPYPPPHRIPAPNHEISAGFWRYASRNADTRMRNPVQVQDEEEEKDED
jgi:hypothetical protein